MCIPLSLLNQPVREDVRELRPGAKQRSLHAVLVEARNNTQALLARSERLLGCCMSPPGIRSKPWRRCLSWMAETGLIDVRFWG